LDGRVLVTGGYSGSGVYVNTAYIYDPTTNTWSSAANMPENKVYHSQSILPNGRVLVTGGSNGSGGYTNTAYIYNPTINTWTAAVNIPAYRGDHGQSTLSDGRVIVTGGVDNTNVRTNTAFICTLNFVEPPNIIPIIPTQNAALFPNLQTPERSA
jgi:Uncharacterized protein conserved in bacteria